VGQNWNYDVRVVLFVVLKDGLSLDDELKLSICNIIRKNTTSRHVPEKIIQIKEIPRTRSGKIVELSVRNVIHGEEVKNTEALANPESLENFRDLIELQS
jgi:acetoacetyl-CoA synthetase